MSPDNLHLNKKGTAILAKDFTDYILSHYEPIAAPVYNYSQGFHNSNSTCFVSSETSLLPEFPKNIKGLKICHLNIRSLPAHIDELRLILDEYPFDILSLNETRLDDSIPGGEISINEYTIHRKDRDRDGGGVAILIRNCINYSKVSIPTPLRDLELFPYKFQNHLVNQLLSVLGIDHQIHMLTSCLNLKTSSN